MKCSALFELQKQHLSTKATLPVARRLSLLKSLQKTINEYQQAIVEALRLDLGKGSSESLLSEIGLVHTELRYAISHLKRWTRPQKKKSPLIHFPSRSYIIAEPLGTALIISPWNYPFLLCITPLIGALSAGCTAILKPSTKAPATAKVLFQILQTAMGAEDAAVVLHPTEDLLSFPFDTLFFTGSTEVGKLVMRKASEHLSRLTLELGGKSPVVVDQSAPIDLTAKRIAFGKMLNAGQTCVAPDYVLVHKSKEEQLCNALEKEFRAAKEYEYPFIINEEHYQRLMALADYQCPTDKDKRIIWPTLIRSVAIDSPLMQQEIFGPLLPVLPYETDQEALQIMQQFPKPLAFYLFTSKRTTVQWYLKNFSFGGGCINDTIVHLANVHLGFGGIGPSGMGSYHGKKSFDAFSHEKSILRKSLYIDVPLRYPPFTKVKQRLLKLFFS